VYVTTKYDSVVDNIRLAGLWDDLHVIEADLRNPDSLGQVQDLAPDLVFHLAAYNHVGDSFQHVQEAVDCNFKGTVNLLEACRSYGRFIYVSSSEVYGYQTEVPFHEEMTPHPLSPYAVGKYAGELYCQMKCHIQRFPITILRPFNTFGPYQSPRAVVAELIIKCLLGRLIETTEGTQTRDFNFVENLVDGFILAAKTDLPSGEIVNLGSGQEVQIAELAHKIHELSGSQSELRIGTLEYRPTEIWRMVAKNSRARESLGWTPRIGLEEGLARTIAWYRDAYLTELYGPGGRLTHLGNASG
jgi:nucleoside-diphosphate-sugar epimerase